MTALADKTSEKNVTSLTSVHKCGVCGISGKLLRCSGCNTVWYCSKEHQLSDWKLRHKRQCTRLDKKIKMEKEKKEIIRKSNTENTEYDFIFVGERGGTQWFEYTGMCGKMMFGQAKKRAEETGDHQSIGMMYQLLRRHIDRDPFSKSEFTERALKNQLNAMYSQNVDFSKCGDMQFINTGGINPILQ
eukprot:76422_1